MTVLRIPAVSFLFFSCAATHNITKGSANHKKIMATEFVTKCPSPDEKYYIHRFNAKVFRHKNCMEVDDLLTVIWSGEITDAAKNGASLLAIGYSVRLNKMNPGIRHHVMPINIDTLTHQNIIYNMYFFELKNTADKDYNENR